MRFAPTAREDEFVCRRRLMADRDRLRESATEMPTPLSVLYSVVEDAQRYDAYLEKTPRGNYDHELADFLLELRDETGRRAKRAEDLLAQRLANGGVQ
jgi:hypothetical protein